MLYIYLDESGDLGFDFVTKKPSNYFTITIMTIPGESQNQEMGKRIKKTIARKLAYNVYELKGSKTSIDVKTFMWTLLGNIDLKLYSVTLNKRRVYKELAGAKDRLYNFIANFILQKMKLDAESGGINLIIDKSKNKKEIYDFNRYILENMKGKVPPTVCLHINHQESDRTPGLQAVDMFSWGFYRKYEKNDNEWFNVFRKKVVVDELYLPPK